MRTRSILTTAASVLLASTVFASAQAWGKAAKALPPRHKRSPRVSKPRRRASPRRASGENPSQKGAQAQEREGSGKQQQGKQETQKEQRGEPKGKDAAQRNERTDGQRGERNEGKDAQRGERNEGKDAQRGERNEGKDAQRGERNEGKDGDRGQQRTGDAGNKNLTVEQKTKVRETVLRGGSAPRVTSVNFTSQQWRADHGSSGAPSVLIEYYPDWRASYFVYNDEIIVDRNHRIIAVLRSNRRPGGELRG